MTEVGHTALTTCFPKHLKVMTSRPVLPVQAAREQAVSGSTAAIEYQDKGGQWHTEIARGDDRPSADVED